MKKLIPVKMEDTMYRQGDILIVSAWAAIPKAAQKQKNCILAHGETTGHTHEISIEEAFLWVDTDGTKYVEVYGKCGTLFHPEHGPITLPGPDIYRIIQQREYISKAIHPVAD